MKSKEAMKIPHSARKRALIVVDVQPRFLNDRMSYIVERINTLAAQVEYSLYFEALFYADENSIWEKQANWHSPEDGNMHTVEPLGSTLKSKQAIQIKKTARSAFKGEPKILDTLRDNQISEIHIVGLDTYDCITATAHEASDLDFFTYIIEECCQATTSQELHERAVANLRQTKLTNNSCVEEIEFITVEVEDK